MTNYMRTKPMTQNNKFDDEIYIIEDEDIKPEKGESQRNNSIKSENVVKISQESKKEFKPPAAGESSVSFKVYIASDNNESNQVQVRRFKLNNDEISISYLTQKLEGFYPTLQGKSYTLTWKDEDGDDIVISSDEELMMAATELLTDVKKIFLNTVAEHLKGTDLIVAVPMSENTEKSTDLIAEQEVSPPAKSSATTYLIHKGVTCDSCSTEIQGIRFKCIECLDYDLCSICEAKGMHVQHVMLRLTKKLTPLKMQEFFKFQLELSKVIRKNGQKNSGRLKSKVKELS